MMPAQAVDSAYDDNRNPINAFAKGGYMEGLSLVGEEGPELVNFSNPGQVYSNTQSNNILGDFANVVASEIASLRAEINSLQASNEKYAMIIAKATVSASGDNAKRITDALNETVSVNNWNSSRNVETMK